MENGNREYTRAVTKFCRCDVRLPAMRIWDIHKLSPDSADATCSSPHLHPTAVDDRCSSTRQGNYTKFRLAPCRQTPPFSLLKSCNLECSNSCNVFNFFDFSTFQYADQRPSFLTFLFILLITDRCSTLATHHPIHRSLYSQVFYYIVVAYHAVIKSRLAKKETWHGIPHLAIPCCS